MSLVEYLDVLRRRWIIPVLLTAAGLAIAWATAPDPPDPQEQQVPRASSYRASHILLVDRASSASVDLPLLVFLADVGEIPQRVSERLGTGDSPAVLADRVQVQRNDDVKALTVSASGQDPAEVERLANTYAEEIVAYAAEQNEQQRQQSIDQARSVVTAQRERLGQIDAELATLPPGTEAELLEAEREALLSALSQQMGRLEQLTAQPPTGAGLATLQPATAVPAGTGSPLSGFEPPGSGPGRLATGGIIGLLLGLGLAMVIEQVDPRIRTSAQAERATGLPVIVAVPRTGRLRRSHLAAVDRPGSDQAQTYARLRVATARVPRWILGPPAPAVSHNGQAAAVVHAHGLQEVTRPVTVIAVTSAGQGENRTVTAANLAACYALDGRTVIAIGDGWDSKAVARSLHPTPQEEPTGDGSADSTLPQTAITGLHLAWLGNVRTGHPGWPAEVVAEARRRCDVVVIDTGPLLASADAALLASEADAVVLTEQAGRTTGATAWQAREYLAQLQVPVLGVVVHGVRRPRVRAGRDLPVATGSRPPTPPGKQAAPAEARPPGAQAERSSDGQ